MCVLETQNQITTTLPSFTGSPGLWGCLLPLQMLATSNTHSTSEFMGWLLTLPLCPDLPSCPLLYFRLDSIPTSTYLIMHLAFVLHPSLEVTLHSSRHLGTWHKGLTSNSLMALQLKYTSVLETLWHSCYTISILNLVSLNAFYWIFYWIYLLWSSRLFDFIFFPAPLWFMHCSSIPTSSESYPIKFFPSYLSH